MPTTRGQGKDLVGAIRLQAAYKTARTNIVSAQGFAPTELGLRGIINEEAEPDHTGRMVRRGSTTHASDAEWDAVVPLKPAGTSSVAPDWIDFLQVGMFFSGVAYSGGTTVSAGATVLSAYLTGVSGLSVGKAIRIETGSGTSNYDFRIITDLSGTTGVGKVVWWPALSAAPVSGARIGSTKTYRLDNTASDTAFTLQSWLTNTSKRVWGAVPESYSFQLGNNTHPMVTMNGFGRGYTQAGPTSLASAMAGATGTTIALVNPDLVGPGFVHVIGSEHLLLSSKNEDGTYTMATAARGLNGTVATSHVAGTAVTVYKPTMTLAGVPIPAQYCCVDVGVTSATVQRLEGTETTVTIDGGLVKDEQLFCDDYITPSYGKGNEMAPQIQVTSKLDDDKMAYFTRAGDGDNVGVVIRMGRRAGRMVGIIAPTALFRAPDATEGGVQGSVPMTLTWEARGLRTGLDAIYFVTG